MTAAVNEKEERLNKTKTPHLSFSRIDRYLRCPEQYRLYYIENLRPKFPSASLLFRATSAPGLSFSSQRERRSNKSVSGPVGPGEASRTHLRKQADLGGFA